MRGEETTETKNLASAYLYFFGALHIISYFFGARITQFDPLISAAFLILICGFGTFFIAWIKHPILCWAWGVFYAVGWAAEFAEWTTWAIPWRHDQYMLLANMNAVAAVCLIYLALGRRRAP